MLYVNCNTSATERTLVSILVVLLRSPSLITNRAGCTSGVRLWEIPVVRSYEFSLRAKQILLCWLLYLLKATAAETEIRPISDTLTCRSKSVTTRVLTIIISRKFETQMAHFWFFGPEPTVFVHYLVPSFSIAGNRGSGKAEMCSLPIFGGNPIDGAGRCWPFLVSSFPIPAKAISHVCVCVFFPSILDIKFVGRTSRGHTGGRSHRISHPPSFCGACLNFSREKDSAIPFPRRPWSRILCTNDLIVLHPLGIFIFIF